MLSVLVEREFSNVENMCFNYNRERLHLVITCAIYNGALAYYNTRSIMRTIRNA